MQKFIYESTLPSGIGFDILSLSFWLAIIIFASYLLSKGSNELSYWLGEKFVGRIVLSIATTFPEIAIVGFAVNDGYLDAALGASIGSNLLMMTLGLSLVSLFATTKLLSRYWVKSFETVEYKTDMYFLAGTALLSLILLIQGIALLSGVIFLAVFCYYAYRAFTEVGGDVEKQKESIEVGKKNPNMRKTIVFLVGGAVGVLVGSNFFIHDLASISAGIGISLAILSIVISPIAGEMPEKISLILLARKGNRGLRIAIANILGSKVLNNTLLLAIFALLAVTRFGLSVSLVTLNVETYQLLLVTFVTILSLVMISRSIDARKAVILFAMYLVCIVLQFVGY